MPESLPLHRGRTIILTAIALTAFAANSVLCRLALGQVLIDAGSFTVIRLVSGAVTLMCIFAITSRSSGAGDRGSWLSAVMLFAYAITFSFAYISLTTGAGALILFGAVQLTMMLSAVMSANRPAMTEWLGALLATAGLVYLVLPGVSAPSFSGSVFMAVAGVAWGVYSLRGRGIRNPLAYTAFNFLRTVPFVAVALFVTIYQANLTAGGIVLAIMSGALASGVGYSIWYAALPGLSASQAAVVQLFVPVLAAAGGVLFMAESVSMRLLVATVVIFSGVSLAFMRVPVWRRRVTGD